MKNEFPLVTIMIPTYNQDAYIGETIKSALAQNYQNLEIIVADDCSSDNTEDTVKTILLEYPQIKYFRNTQNTGRVKNYRKTLYERANGEYVVNLDGDDLFIDSTFISNAIQTLYSIAEEDRPLLYIACKRLVSKDRVKDNLHNIENNEMMIPGEEFIKNLYRKYYFSHLTSLYNRQAALDTNFYYLDVISSDSDSLVRLAAKGNVFISNRVVGQWNETDSNESKVPDFEKQLRNMDWITSVNNAIRGSVSFRSRMIWKYYCIYIYSFNVVRILLMRKNRHLKNFSSFISSRYSFSMTVFYLFHMFRKRSHAK